MYLYKRTLTKVGVFLLYGKEMVQLMIVRIKNVSDVDTQEKVRERIKEQMKEGLIVHDDTIEIIFADEMCLECGSTNLEEYTVKSDEGDIFSHVLRCNKCNRYCHSEELIK